LESDLIDKLAAICERHVGNSNDPAFNEVVFPEPYVPYIPGGWNGVLVVAAAQNLSQKNEGYVQNLRDPTSPQDRIRRLQLARLHPEGGIGVQPWDDGLLPLAIEAALKVDPEHVAVSNAVPWSLRTPTGANINPTPGLRKLAISFWQDLLMTMRPSHIVAAGVTAGNVMKRACTPDLGAKVTVWISPSPRVLSLLPGKVSQDGRKKRFWEVAAALEHHPEWDKPSNVLYACLAILLSDANAQPPTPSPG